MNRAAQHGFLRYRIMVAVGGSLCLPSLGLFLLFVLRVNAPGNGWLFPFLGMVAWAALAMLASRRFLAPERRLPTWLVILNWISCLIAGVYGVVLGLLLGGIWTLVFVGIPVSYAAILLVWEVLPKDPWD